MQELFDFTKNAEQIEVILKNHIHKFWDALSEIRKADIKVTAGRDRAKADASREYWNRLNRAVPCFLADEDGEPDFAPLYEQLKVIAVNSFRENLPSTSPWHVMACGKVMPFFLSALNRIVNPYLSKGDI